MVIKPTVDPFIWKSFDFNIRYESCVVLVKKSVFLEKELIGEKEFSSRDWIPTLFRDCSIDGGDFCLHFYYTKNSGWFDDPWHDINSVNISSTTYRFNSKDLFRIPPAQSVLIPFKSYNLYVDKKTSKTQRRGIGDHTMSVRCAINNEIQLLRKNSRSIKVKSQLPVGFSAVQTLLYIGDVLANKPLVDIPIPIAEDMVLSGKALSVRVNNDMEVGVSAFYDSLVLYKRTIPIGTVNKGKVSLMSDVYREVVVENGGVVV